MKNENYYIGLDIGTDSVGYAVTDENYSLCKYRGEPMWGVTLPENANLSAERRGFRTARRRLARRQQRVRLLQELFAAEIAKTDEGFFQRIRESYRYPESEDDKIRVFAAYEAQKAYDRTYPTIHHLLYDLMINQEPHDAREVYLACAWLVAHRGHFLNEVDKTKVEEVTEFEPVWRALEEFLQRDGDDLPWSSPADLSEIQTIFRNEKDGITKKSKALEQCLLGGNMSEEEKKKRGKVLLKALCGGKVSLESLFNKEEYGNLEEKSVALNMEEEKFINVLSTLEEDDAELLRVMKAVYDWSVLSNVLNGKQTLSEAKVEVYEQHKNDLKWLKSFVKAYLPQKYKEIFRSEGKEEKEKGGIHNYVSYSAHHAKSCVNAEKCSKSTQEDFCKYILSLIKDIEPKEEDREAYETNKKRLENKTFMPKQVTGDNRVIPYQLYWYELNKILENAKGYLPFLWERDKDGVSGAEKILAIFTFRIPYYVGPLKEKEENGKYYHWMVRKAEGRILPWNFEEKVDLDQSEEAFIRRMTNRCTYLPGEDVLPKNSLLYCAFTTLNELNPLTLNGHPILVSLKQELYTECIAKNAKKKKISRKQILEYLIANGYAQEDDVLSGMDDMFKSSLQPFWNFEKLRKDGILSNADVERIIERMTYSEEAGRVKRWLQQEYPALSEEDVSYLAKLKYHDFGRLSREFLCQTPITSQKTGEYYPSVIRAMWETNYVLKQLLSDQWNLQETIQEKNREYYAQHPKNLSERMDEMYLSNAVKRPIIRTLDIVKDVVKVQGKAPEKIFVEMARGGTEEQKGKRTKSRLEQLRAYYQEAITEPGLRDLVEQRTGELNDDLKINDNSLQQDSLFLYFIQLGKCLYTDAPINIDSVLCKNGDYNIEHIYPQSFVKDDSILNNKILVDSKVNGDKSDTYPVKPEIQRKMRPYWEHLRKVGLMTEEKFKRLIRSEPFSEEERYAFINRQLTETRQSTKALTALLKERYPDTRIVYVKAGTVSEFRQKFQLPKSRTVNDLHHAKDAYLNIAVGNVWDCKFSRQWYREDADNNIKAEKLFKHAVQCGGKIAWDGTSHLEKVKSVAQKNTPHLTVYSYCKKGGLFDQQPLPAAEGLIPRKQGLPTERYGGYNKSSAAFFVLTRYAIGKKYDILVTPIELMFAERFLKDEAFALAYAKQTVAQIKGKKEEEIQQVTFLLDRRILKVKTMLSLDGFRVCITGKDSNGKMISVTNMMPFLTDPQTEQYIKRLESFEKKSKNNSGLEPSERHDQISRRDNEQLYDLYVKKFQTFPYNKRPTDPVDILVKGREKFLALDVKVQITVLLQIQGLFGRAKTAKLDDIGGGKNVGANRLSSSVSNWKKSYKDVRILDSSASGLFESRSENLLDLL